MEMSQTLAQIGTLISEKNLIPLLVLISNSETIFTLESLTVALTEGYTTVLILGTLLGTVGSLSELGVLELISGTLAYSLTDISSSRLNPLSRAYIIYKFALYFTLRVLSLQLLVRLTTDVFPTLNLKNCIIWGISGAIITAILCMRR